MKTKLFVALDYPSAEDALTLIRKLEPIKPSLKIGLELFCGEGPEFVRRLVGEGHEVFLDLKFHDIPNTVAGAVAQATRLGVQYLNVHCAGGAAMMKAAVESAKNAASEKNLPPPILLGVTVLTSLDDEAVKNIGFPRTASDQVKHFVELAQAGGLDGVVCSAQELPLVRSLAGGSFYTMVPGIRPAGSSAGDQKRTLTPGEAARAGAHGIVVGRPISTAHDPLAKARAIMGEL